eukprot:4694813-Amphidinium_carterae.1
MRFAAGRRRAHSRSSGGSHPLNPDLGTKGTPIAVTLQKDSEASCYLYTSQAMEPLASSRTHIASLWGFTNLMLRICCSGLVTLLGARLQPKVVPIVVPMSYDASKTRISIQLGVRNTGVMQLVEL